MSLIISLVFMIPTILSIYLSVRLIYIVLQRLVGNRSFIKSKTPIQALIVIGSGGHTAEMLRLMKKMNKSKFMPRLYVVAYTDITSCIQIENDEYGTDWSIASIPRSRHVHQSYLSSFLSTIYSIVMAMPIVVLYKPDLVLCNGPGTCFPVCFIVLLMRLFHYADTSVIFVESICRVKTLSLTGKLMFIFADLIIVQWPELSRKYGWRVKYLDEALFS